MKNRYVGHREGAARLLLLSLHHSLSKRNKCVLRCALHRCLLHVSSSLRHISLLRPPPVGRPVAQELLGSGQMHSVKRSPQRSGQRAELSGPADCTGIFWCLVFPHPRSERVVRTRTKSKRWTKPCGVRFYAVAVSIESDIGVLALFSVGQRTESSGMIIYRHQVHNYTHAAPHFSSVIRVNSRAKI